MKYVGTILFSLAALIEVVLSSDSASDPQIYTADPATLLLLAAAAAATGAVVQAQAVRQQTKTQAALQQYNARVEEQKAEQLEQAGDVAGGEERKATRIELARVRAKRGASGVQQTGSPLLKQIDIAEAGALDAATVDYNTRIGVSRLESGAGLLRSQAKSTRRAGRRAVGAALFSGASQGLQLGAQSKQAGVT